MIKDKSGINLGEDKAYLIESRLKPIARKHGLADLDELIAKVKVDTSSPYIADIIDSMTTNESLFFRDLKPFQQVENIVLPKFAGKPLKIWSAAASTGQEAYSLAITFEEKMFKNYSIIGTDISPTVIHRAKEGKYTQFEIQRGMPITMLLKYFVQDADCWTVKPEMKRKIQFDTFNLLDNYAKLGSFDLVFCRNVLIYFDKETKKQIFDKLRQIINPGGYLFLGTSETVMGITDKFKPISGEPGMLEPV